MAMYRTYFLNLEGHIRAAEEIEAADHAEAVRQSLRILEQRPQHRTVEVWQEGRRIYPSTLGPQEAGAEPAAGTALSRAAPDPAAFLRLAATTLRRLADRTPEISEELRRIAEDAEAYASGLGAQADSVV